MKNFGYFLGICLLLVSLLIIASCKKSGLTQSDIDENDFAIAEIDSEFKIMASDLYDRLKDSKILYSGGYLDSTTYFDTLQDIVIDSLISIEARDIKLDDYDLQWRKFKRDYRAAYVKYLFDRLIVDSVSIDSSDVDTFYQAHIENYVRPEEFRVSHLIISGMGLKFGKDSAQYKEYSTEQLDSIAGELIYDYKAMADSGATFGDLALKYSMHKASAENQGDLGYFRRGTYFPEFETAVCSLEIGKISEPFKTKDGWHIALLTDHLDSTTLGLDEVYDMAYYQLLNDGLRVRSTQFIDSITNASEFIFNDSAISQTATTVPDTTWALVVNSRDTIDFYSLSELFYDYKKYMGLDSLTTDDKKTALMGQANQILIAQAGDHLGFADDSQMVKEKNELYHRYAKVVVGRQSEDSNYDPPDSLIEDYYNKNTDKYIIKKPINVQHIIVEDSIFGEFLRDQALSGIDFLELARQHYPGAEDIRVAAADLGYIGEGEMPEEFFKMAMRTAKGDISHPVKTEWGYHIIYVVDKQMNRSLEQVRNQIANVLRGQYQEDFKTKWHRDIMSRHDIVYNLDRVKKIQLPPFDERK